MPKFEKWILGALIAVAMLFNAAPYIYQAAYPVPGKVYVGSFPIILDKATYLAKMQQGYEGQWQYVNRYTSEQQRPVFLQTFYLALGHIARSAHLSLETVFLMARFLFGMLFIMVVVKCVRSFIGDTFQRIFTYIFIFFTPGLAWLTWLTGGDAFGFLDAIPMVRFSHFPHVIFAHTLLIAILTLLFHYGNDRKRWRVILAGTLSAMVNLVLPFHSLLLFPLVIILSAFFWKKVPTWRRRLLIDLAIYFCIALPTFILVASVAIFEPIWTAVEKNNVLPPIPPLDMALGYGILWIFLFASIRLMVRERTAIIVFCLIWLMTSITLMYLAPVLMQRRFFEAAQFFPVAILSSFGVHSLWSFFKRKHQSFTKLAIVLSLVLGCLLCFILTSVVHWKVFLALYKNTNDPRLFVPVENVQAMQWLDAHLKKESVILSSPYNGNIIPAITAQTAFVGHWAETLFPQEKTKQTYDLLHGDLSLENIKVFLRDKKIDYIFYSSFEKISPSFTPDSYSFLSRVYREGDVSIYRVLVN